MFAIARGIRTQQKLLVGGAALMAAGWGVSNVGSTMAQSNSSQVEQWIKKENDSHQVVIYSKSWCHYCSTTKKVFQHPSFSSLDVQVHELDKRPDGEDIQDALEDMTGQYTVPSVWVQGHFIGGNDDTQRALSNGVLQTMLGVQR